MGTELLHFIKSKSLRARAMKGFIAFLVLMIVFTLLSRAADAMTIPQVNTDTAKKGTIDKTIKASGSVQQNDSQAITTVAGIRVKKINVAAGQIIAKGDVLFELDLDDLKDQILALEQEIKVMDLEASDRSYNAALAENENAKKKNQAVAEYNEAVTSADKKISRAAQAVTDAKQAIENYKKNNSKTADQLNQEYQAAEAALKQAQNQQKTLENEVENAVNTALSKAQAEAEEDLSQAELDEIEDEIRAKYEKQLSDAQQAIEEAQQTRDSALVSLNNADQQTDLATLEDALRQAQDAYQDAVDEKQLTINQQNRSIENSTTDRQADSTETIKEMERETKVRNLEKLQALQEAKGIVTSPIDALVMEIGLSLGGDTPDGMAMILADVTSGSRFTAQLTEEEQKLISRDDVVALKTDNKTLTEMPIDAITQNSEDKSLYDVSINVPAGELEVGTNATLEFTKKSKSYSQVIPIDALHGSDGDYYIFAIKESDTILGKEQTVEKISVLVQEKNEKYAALSEGSITSDQQIVTASNKDISDGDRVRLQE